MFRGRAWPEGYEFPSCVGCNRSTREDERIVALLARITFDDPTDAEVAEFEQLVRAVSVRQPAVIDAMTQSTANDCRRWLRQRGLRLPRGASTADFPLVRLDTRVDDAVRRFGGRLGRALHYLHTGQILPVDGEVIVAWYTNANLIDGSFPTEVLDVLPGRPSISRGGRQLSDQFNYRYAKAEKGEASLFGCGVGPSLFLYLVAFADASHAARFRSQRKAGWAATSTGVR